MMLRAAAAAFLVIAAGSATALAQAPGDMPVEGGPSMYTATPVPAAPSVMNNRWAVGLSVGSLSVAPKDTPDNKTEFGVGELSLRYRATLHLELELALGGGQQQLPDGTKGDLEAHLATIDLRYRFAPEQHWNWWVMGGLGGMSVVQTGATDQQVSDANRPVGTLGIGLEHRWTQFAIHAELRAMGIGPQKNADTVMPVAPAPAGSTTTTQPPPPAPTMAAGTDRWSGGQFTIGASYYF
ncbi:MAG: outer membrane beta-barrel protein [Acidobacteriota bacterium]